MSARRRAAALAVALLVAAGCGGDDDDATSADAGAEVGTEDADVEADEVDAAEIDGLVLSEGLSAGHARGELEYPSLTPVGGDHNPFWQKCGQYTVEIPAERAVHSLEHGAVWIAHQPGVDVSSLEAVVAGDQWMLMSPIEGLGSPLVVSAWGAQITADDADDPRIAAFIDAYIRRGPEAAPCVRGGVGEPPTDIGPGLDA
ncbi:MAG: DUF3105 domain-containing protein [Actinomycetota bacterium]